MQDREGRDARANTPSRHPSQRRRLSIQLSSEQQLILALLLVILVAISMLYCLGFASVALHSAWETAPPSWNDSISPDVDFGTEPALPTAEPAPLDTAAP